MVCLKYINSTTERVIAMVTRTTETVSAGALSWGRMPETDSFSTSTPRLPAKHTNRLGFVLCTQYQSTWNICFFNYSLAVTRSNNTIHVQRTCYLWMCYMQQLYEKRVFLLLTPALLPRRWGGHTWHALQILQPINTDFTVKSVWIK